MASENTTQISANISLSTKERMERYAKAYGLKKAFLIETALLHHLNVLDEIPLDIVIPPRIIITKESGKRVIESIQKPPEPTEAIKALFDD